MSSLPILIVEDSASDLHMVEQALLRAKLRCELSAATSGAAGIELISNRSTDQPPFALLLLDLSLTDMDGLDMLDQTVALPALDSAIIVALTGSRDPGIIHMARERGVHALMNKPLNVSHLIGIMNEQGFWIELRR